MQLTSRVNVLQQGIKVFHGAKDWIDVLVVGYIIPEIFEWRLVYGAQPQGLNTEVLKIIQAGSDACQSKEISIVQMHLFTSLF